MLNKIINTVLIGSTISFMSCNDFISNGSDSHNNKQNYYNRTKKFFYKLGTLKVQN